MFALIGRHLVAGCTLFALLLSMSSALWACEIRVRVSQGMFPPSFMKDDDGKYVGLSVELAEALLKEAGCKAILSPMPFKRGLHSLKIGKVDLMMNLSMTDERKAFIHFLGPQMDETVLMVVRKDSDFGIESLDDIKALPLKIGVSKGVFYGEAFSEKLRTDDAFKAKIEEEIVSKKNVTKLNAGRISGFLGQSYNVFYRIKNNPEYKAFKPHPYMIYRNWVYFGFSKKTIDETLLQRLQDAYTRARDKKLFRHVFERYEYSGF